MKKQALMCYISNASTLTAAKDIPRTYSITIIVA